MCTSSKIWPGFLFVLIVPIANAKNEDNETVTNDQLQGEWIVNAMQFADFTIRGTDEKPIRVSIVGDKISIRPRIEVSSHWTLSIGTNGYGLRNSKTDTLVFTDGVQRMTFNLDETKKPVQLDMKEEQAKGTVWKHGICRVKDEYLELCIASRDHPRPLDFILNRSIIMLQLKRSADKN